MHQVLTVSFHVRAVIVVKQVHSLPDTIATRSWPHPCQAADSS